MATGENGPAGPLGDFGWFGGIMVTDKYDRTRMDERPSDLPVIDGCDWLSEGGSLCPVDPCQCRRAEGSTT